MNISIESVKKISEILQLPKYCTSATIRLEPNNCITLEVISVLDEEVVEDLCEVLKKFKLVEVGGE